MLNMRVCSYYVVVLIFLGISVELANGQGTAADYSRAASLVRLAVARCSELIYRHNG